MILVVWGALVLFSLACSAESLLPPSPTPKPTLTETPTSTPTATFTPAHTATFTPTFTPLAPTEISKENWPLVLLDTFENNDNAWETGVTTDEDETKDISIVDGVYRVDVTDIHGVMNSFGPAIDPVADFFLSVEGKRDSGTANIDYGLEYRINDNYESYMFCINEGKKTFWVGLWESHIWSYLIPEKKSASILQGKFNQIAVKAKGPQMSFYINGKLVGEVNDSRLSAPGTAGVMIDIKNDNDQGVIVFDNFKLYAPK